MKLSLSLCTQIPADSTYIKRPLTYYNIFFILLSFIILDCANVMTVLFLETKKNYIIILQTSNLIWLPLHYYACRHRVRRINKIVNIIIRSFEISFHINRNCLSNVHIENSFANLKEIMILNFEDIQNSTFNIITSISFIFIIITI